MSMDPKTELWGFQQNYVYLFIFMFYISILINVGLFVYICIKKIINTYVDKNVRENCMRVKFMDWYFM